jgi:hypothetical protein
MRHLNAVADVFETSCGNLKLLLDNGLVGTYWINDPDYHQWKRSLAPRSGVPIWRDSKMDRIKTAGWDIGTTQHQPLEPQENMFPAEYS